MLYPKGKPYRDVQELPTLPGSTVHSGGKVLNVTYPPWIHCAFRGNSLRHNTPGGVPLPRCSSCPSSPSSFTSPSLTFHLSLEQTNLLHPQKESWSSISGRMAPSYSFKSQLTGQPFRCLLWPLYQKQPLLCFWPRYLRASTGVWNGLTPSSAT